MPGAPAKLSLIREVRTRNTAADDESGFPVLGALKGTNLALAFLLEIVALIAFAFWGWTVGSNTATRLLLVIALPLAAAAVWGLFLSPKPDIQLPYAVVALAQFLFFALAVGALWASGHHVLSVITAAVLVVNRLLFSVWGP
jgi:Protein of unknown function (DUF2568)